MDWMIQFCASRDTAIGNIRHAGKVQQALLGRRKIRSIKRRAAATVHHGRFSHCDEDAVDVVAIRRLEAAAWHDSQRPPGAPSQIAGLTGLESVPLVLSVLSALDICFRLVLSLGTMEV